MEDRPRLKGHKLVKLSALLAVCECGTRFEMSEVEASGRKTPALKDELMDRHSNHLGLLRYAQKSKLRRKIE